MRHTMPEFRAGSPATTVRPRHRRAFRIVRDAGRSAESGPGDEPAQHAAHTLPSTEAKDAGARPRSARRVAPTRAQNAAADIGP